VVVLKRLQLEAGGCGAVRRCLRAGVLFPASDSNDPTRIRVTRIRWGIVSAGLDRSLYAGAARAWRFSVLSM